MRTTKALGVTFCVAGLLACASLPPPSAESPRSAGIGLSVKVFDIIGIFSQRPARVFFLKLDEEDESGFTRGTLFQSNYTKGDYVYFLNAPPGRYVAVASTRTQSAPPGGPAMVPVASSGHGTVSVGISIGTTDYTTYFPDDLIRLTDVTVELGRKKSLLSEVEALKENDVIDLAKLAGEAFDIVVNGHVFGEGEIVVVTDLLACRVTHVHVPKDSTRNHGVSLAF